MNIGDKKVFLVSGLDLGQAQDYTAWAITERTATCTQVKPHRKYETQTVIKHLQRFPPGTAYAEIFQHLFEQYQQAPLYQSYLVIDLTGVGKSVIDFFRQFKIPSINDYVAITSGHLASKNDQGEQQIPKKDLISKLQLMLQNRELKIARSMQHADILIDELQQFQMKPQLVNDQTHLSWRERPHDDLVLAVALACWRVDRVLSTYDWVCWMRERTPEEKKWSVPLDQNLFNDYVDPFK